MQLKELRQCNYISWTGDYLDSKDKTVEVVKILKTKVTVKYENYEFNIGIKQISPLKITETFLTNQGFEYIGLNSFDSSQKWRKKSPYCIYEFTWVVAKTNYFGIMGIYGGGINLGSYFSEPSTHNFCWNIENQHHFQNLCNDLSI